MNNESCIQYQYENKHQINCIPLHYNTFHSLTVVSLMSKINSIIQNKTVALKLNSFMFYTITSNNGVGSKPL